jgi:hypothetical protein
VINLAQIPDEVVEAAGRAYEASCRKLSPAEIPRRAAIAAVLNAWPDRHLHEWQRPWLGGMNGTDIILPLTQQDSDE